MKEIFSDAYLFYIKNFKQIAALCLPLLFINALLQYLLMLSDSLQFLSLPTHFALYPIYTAALILMMAKQAQQEFPENKELVFTALKLYRPMFMLSIAVVALVAIGIMFLIIPGLWIAARLSFSEYYLIVHGFSPREAIQQSFQATRTHFWKILSALLIVVCPIWLAEYFTASYIRGLFPNPLITILIKTAGSYLMLFSEVVIFRIFMDAVLRRTELKV